MKLGENSRYISLYNKLIRYTNQNILLKNECNIILWYKLLNIKLKNIIQLFTEMI